MIWRRKPCCDALRTEVATLANLVARLSYLAQNDDQADSRYAIIERRADAIHDRVQEDAE